MNEPAGKLLVERWRVAIELEAPELEGIRILMDRTPEGVRVTAMCRMVAIVEIPEVEVMQNHQQALEKYAPKLAVGLQEAVRDVSRRINETLQP